MFLLMSVVADLLETTTTGKQSCFWSCCICLNKAYFIPYVEKTLPSSKDDFFYKINMSVKLYR